MIDFLGIGAMKAGSNWQRRWLNTHPGIFIAPAEIHFWDGRKGPSLDKYHANFADAQAGQSVGEITPAYAILDDNGIASIRDYNPNLRIFYCLRNPIDRLWAHIRMGHNQGRLDLRQAADAEIIALFEKDPWKQHGAYRENIERCRNHFGTDALHISFFEDITERPVVTLAGLASHIGADPSHFENLPEDQLAALAEPVFAADDIAMPASILAYLRAEYTDQIMTFGDFVGRDLSQWVDKPSCAIRPES